MKRDIWSGKTCAQAQYRILEIGRDIELLETRKKKFYAWADEYRFLYQHLVLDDVDDWNEQLRNLHYELSKLETFLMECDE